MKFDSGAVRRACRTLHRDLSFFFAGVVLIYALSGIAMNHRDRFDPDYAVCRRQVRAEHPLPPRDRFSRADAEALLAAIGEADTYKKHYFPDERTLKVFFGEGSSLTVDLTNGDAVAERLVRRPVWSALTRLHYNPGSWWTLFADLFGGALILITLTGLAIVRGTKGLWGRGGIELLGGLLFPFLFLFF